jgi:hypothetical protein
MIIIIIIIIIIIWLKGLKIVWKFGKTSILGKKWEKSHMDNVFFFKCIKNLPFHLRESFHLREENHGIPLSLISKKRPPGSSNCSVIYAFVKKT